MAISIWLKWLFFLVTNAVLGASVIMMVKGTLPPPMTRVKVRPVVATSLFVVGMTGLLVFGEPDLLEATLNLLTGK
jgi:hypothetical protein